MSKKILILTASFGMGHYSVSRAIKEKISSTYDTDRIEIVDVLEILDPVFKKNSQKLYNKLTRDFEELYNVLYYYKRMVKNNWIDEVVYMRYFKGFKQFIEASEPDVVISTFPMTSGLSAMYKRRFVADWPLITVITDVIDSWEWVHRGTDLYFVPSTEVRENLIEKGVKREQIEVTGIPVKDAFTSSDRYQGHQKKHVLIFSSAMGKIDLDDDFLKELAAMTTIQFTLVTGSDTALWERLKGKSYKNVTVLGFVEDVASLMEKSDLVYTKPGGVTLFEAINKEVPLMLQETRVGQEKANIDFVKNRELGVVVPQDASIADVIKRVITDDVKLYEMKSNMYEFKKELQSDAILKAVE
ncbi:MAG: processive 1,2-diacylglycerol beta-glucosyltransferase [Clostridiales bacterium]|nr:processive 1,2-diacylglycerol beta-glucosyltransferase [Clostridiales bacterium]